MHVPAQRAEGAGRALAGTLAVVAVGGALGGCARYGLTLAWPVARDAGPWPVLAVNAAGSALIGVVMVLLAERPGADRRPLLRPFLGTGVLGGFTTFSTYAADVVGLLERGETWTALGCAAGTPAAALGAVWAAATLTRRAMAPAGGGDDGAHGSGDGGGGAAGDGAGGRGAGHRTRGGGGGPPSRPAGSAERSQRPQRPQPSPRRRPQPPQPPRKGAGP
ncbi:CrcB family protein [Streptomyces sp. PLAI1-29]|uniref:Fluoride-specific ion channel FluC n=1 Tax=Streptomyces zingiberis TaxID=2053010 RepID=A0ABX1C773_9ACTN|nr:CrcB family protein [Streptomyces zingiberis]